MSFSGNRGRYTVKPAGNRSVLIKITGVLIIQEGTSHFFFSQLQKNLLFFLACLQVLICFSFQLIELAVDFVGNYNPPFSFRAVIADIKVVLEENIVGREIECSVLGNDEPVASTVGEIGTDDGFYSYEKKYIDGDGAKLIIPASMDSGTLQRVQETAITAFKVLESRGMARVDMFLTENDEIYVNEINTIPGFTAISMYPKLWKASGLSYTDLIDRLIQLAIEEHSKKSQLKTTGY